MKKEVARMAMMDCRAELARARGDKQQAKSFRPPFLTQMRQEDSAQSSGRQCRLAEEEKEEVL